MNVKNIGDGVSGVFVENNRFNTTLISFNFYLPLKKETVAENALLPFVLTTCGKEYPSFSRLNYKLASLYGASLEATAEKLGDLQLLRMAVSTINDEYTLDGENVVLEATKMLNSLLFNPKAENGEFCEADVEREKRKAIEHIRGELNEKRLYAKQRLIEEMYKGTPYGLPKCGTEADVNAITGKSLFDAWQNMLKSAYIRVQVVGKSIPNGLFENLSEAFSKIERQNITDIYKVTGTEKASEVKTVTEKMDIAQGKLVMGFSCDLFGDYAKTLPLMVTTDIFGGGPYSRLFSNVREKLSLCYYCSASGVRSKGLLTVESGVESKNAEAAQKEILNQLEIVKRGEFGDFEYNSSIKSICDSLNSYYDSQISIDLWYALRALGKELLSPEDVAERIAKVTKEDIMETAKGINLNTVYKLLPKE